MIDALIAGRIYGKPMARVASNGNPYATAKIRAATASGETIFVNVIAFEASAVEALLALSDGDSISLTGEATPKTWTDPKDGSIKPALDLKAHKVVSPYHVARKRKVMQQLHPLLPFLDEPLPEFDDPLPVFGTAGR